ncbi:MASE1 domain-containing protein [Burkholderia guangdongensis]|uniref:MASE1 domain-containing protein n=1 Tax=Burkholderia guangdongensis TaxID=1792500 RepID=UPI0015C9A126|nr:MASE1 domain-containing protein [Burkholderia guangdongensis]
MSSLRLHFWSIAGTVVVFILSLWLNEVIFTHSEFVRGVNWIYLPSGVRLLSTLLLGGDGAIGLLIASLLVNFFYFFPHDPVRSIAGAIISTVAPYAVYRLAIEWYGLRASLTNLTPKRLLLLAIAYSVANPLLLHVWFFLQGNTHNFGERLLVMIVGDLAGALIVLYVVKGAISLLRVRHSAPIN